MPHLFVNVRQAPQKLEKCKETVPITNEKTARSLIVAG